MCSLEVHCYNKQRDGKEYYENLSNQMDENQIKKEMRKKICDQHLQSQPYND